MYTVTDLCSLCLSNEKTMIGISSTDEDGIVVKNKLEYALTEVMNYKPEILKSICRECLKELNYVYKFKQKCLQNVMSLNDFIEKMTVEHYFVSTSEDVQPDSTEGHFLANVTQNNKVIDTNSAQNVKTELEDNHDNSEMHCETIDFEENVFLPRECNLTINNSIFADESFSLNTNHISKKNESEIVKKEPEFIHDEVEIKYDPLLTDDENSRDTLSDEATNNSEESSAVQTSLPMKSKEKYESAYQQFETWFIKKKVKTIKEDVLLAYFEEKSKVLKSSSLWCLYSMLRTTLSLKKNVDIKKYMKLIAFIKRNSIGQQAKKASILTKADVEKFLKEADDDTYLLMKVILIIGISGACARDELAYLRLDNIKDMSTFILVEIPRSARTNTRREFPITSGSLPGLDFLAILRKYVALRPAPPAPPHARFFLAYRHGKCTRQSVGINSIGAVPRRVAEYLGLAEPHTYTGHSFRRSSAAVLASQGEFVTVKRLGGWK